MCKICMDSPIDCVLLECGHMVTCTKCGKRMSECPICRQYVVRAVHVFRSWTSASLVGELEIFLIFFNFVFSFLKKTLWPAALFDLPAAVELWITESRYTSNNCPCLCLAFKKGLWLLNSTVRSLKLLCKCYNAGTLHGILRFRM